MNVKLKLEYYNNYHISHNVEMTTEEFNTFQNTNVLPDSIESTLPKVCTDAVTDSSYDSVETAIMVTTIDLV